MKRFLLMMLLVFALCISLSACNSSSNTGDENNAPKDNASSSVGCSDDFITEYENLNVYNDSFGDPHAVYVAELKNNSEYSLTITNASIDVVDKEGVPIISTDFISFYPFVIEPGESAFICEEVANVYSDEGLDFNTIDKAILNYNTEEHAASDSIDVEFSNLNVTNYDGQVNVTGSIKNLSEEPINETCVCLPIRDSAGKLQYFMFTPVENLEANETRDFEQFADSFDPNVDFSNSTIDAFAYSSIAEAN